MILNLGRRLPAAGTAMSLRGLARPDVLPDVRLYSSTYADQCDTVSHIHGARGLASSSVLDAHEAAAVLEVLKEFFAP